MNIDSTTSSSKQPPTATYVLIAGGGPCGLMASDRARSRKVFAALWSTQSHARRSSRGPTRLRPAQWMQFQRFSFAQEVRALGLSPAHPTDVAYLGRYAGDKLARTSLPSAPEAVVNINTMTMKFGLAAT